jgi:hypothetical protein
LWGPEVLTRIIKTRDVQTSGDISLVHTRKNTSLGVRVPIRVRIRVRG